MSFPRLVPRHICATEVSEATSNGGEAERWKQCHSAFGMPELASEACGVLGAGLSKERIMLHWRHTTLDILFALPQNHGSWKFENGHIFVYISSL